MRDHIFRKYDIRGIVGKDLAIDAVYNFGRALAFYFTKRNPDLKTIVVGMDGRLHSEAIKDELVRALLESGLDVRFIGVCPTPVLYFALHNLTVDAGVMITASHNDKEYNGFKICLGKEMIWSHEIEVLRTLYKRKVRMTLGRTGILTKSSLTTLYINWLERAFSHLKKADIAAVLDCGNGAAGAIIPELVERMGWKNIVLLHPEIDGAFPHRAPDPTSKHHVQGTAQAIQLHKADVGIGFDGDADRMVAMTHDGVLVPGDVLLALFSEAILEEHPGAAVVFDSKCSQMLSSMLKKWGAEQHMAPTGHAAVKKMMQEKGALLAGELSAHFIFKDRYFGFDDGIYAMMRLFEILHDSGATLRQLIDRFPVTYKTEEIRISCSESSKEAIIQSVHNAFVNRDDTAIMTLDGVRITTPYGWGIVRASNTQPVISFCCESETKEGFEQIKKDFSKAFEPSLNQKLLQADFELEQLAHR